MAKRLMALCPLSIIYRSDCRIRCCSLALHVKLSTTIISILSIQTCWTMSRTFRMLSNKVSTSKRKMLHMLHFLSWAHYGHAPAEVQQMYKQKEGSHAGKKQSFFYATFFRTAENAAKHLSVIWVSVRHSPRI